MTAREDPVPRILDGLVAAIDRHGSQKVSVADVCEEAGVSRGTVYRYFPTRADLFAALGSHALGWYRRAVADAVDADPAPERRIAVVVTALAGMVGDGRGFRRIYRSEPAYVLLHFQTYWNDYIAVLRQVLAPAFAEAERDGPRVDAAADVLARHLLTRQLIRPGPTSDADLVQLLERYTAPEPE